MRLVRAAFLQNRHSLAVFLPAIAPEYAARRLPRSSRRTFRALLRSFLAGGIRRRCGDLRRSGVALPAIDTTSGTPLPSCATRSAAFQSSSTRRSSVAAT